MQAIFDALKGLYDFIVGIPQWILDQFIKVFTSLLLMLKDVVCWILEQLLGLATSAMNAFDFSAISSHLGAFGQVPADVVNILGLIGVGDCLAIITSALIIRLVLQLIPFVRLGS